MLTHPVFSNIPNLAHGFTIKDEPDNDHTFIAQQLGVSNAQVCFLDQVHSNLVHVQPQNQLLVEGDGHVTKQSGVILVIKSADCVPILLVDPISKIIGACHSGWRSTLKNVVFNTIEAMHNLGAKTNKIQAVIGPAIQQNSYTVDQVVFNAFIQQSAAWKKFFTPFDAKHWSFDLVGVVAEQLKQLKISEVANMQLDTFTEENLFHSWRRSTLRQEPCLHRQ